MYIVQAGKQENYEIFLTRKDHGQKKQYCFIVHADADVKIFLYAIEDLSIDVDIEIILQGERAHAQLYGAYLVASKHTIKINTVQKHIGKATKSELLLKGMVQSIGRLQFHGLINIEKQAIASFALQENKHILLGSQAIVKTVPSIEVLNNDVQCFHGAATGKFDYMQCWYLEQKGFSVKQAKHLLIRSFFQEALQHFAQHEQLMELICQKIF